VDHRQHLDGLWEFLPWRDVEPQHASDHAPPRAGYEDTRIRVPGYWNTFPAAVGGDWGAYQHYRYPPQWQHARSAWYRRRFRPEAPHGGRNKRTRLHFEAVAGKATAWLNGQRLGENVDSFLPFAFDVTQAVRPGEENELVVLVQPPPTKDGLWLQPCGSWVGWHLRGIWQSVCVQSTPATAIRDVFAQPSVRQAKLTVDVTIELAPGERPQELCVCIADESRVVLDLGWRTLDPSAGREQTLRFEAPNPGLEFWSPERPRLYYALAELRENGHVVHHRHVRFGFREFWIDGTGFRLNGEPIRLFGDAWHYMGAAQQNPAYARTWYEFAKKTGVNAIRTHAMPYPPFYFDLADELGLLIVAESAIYGSAGTLAYDVETFWNNCRDHIRRMVLRDRNHPSIVFWSACNETVWKGGERIYPQLLSLGEQARTLDPTRFVSYDENDCDLGGASPVHAGHYGTPAHWERSWQRDKPLIIHEFSSLYHGGPDEVAHIGNDAVYADYHARLRAAGEEAADMFLRLRSLGAASITPWNLNWYCLEPVPAEPVENVPSALIEGGAAVQRIGERALTFNYGYLPGEPPYRPNPAYEPLAACYRRRRFFVTRRPRQGFGGERIELAAEVWNDQPQPAELTLVARLRGSADDVHAETRTLSLEKCASAAITLSIPLPRVTAKETYVAELTLVDRTSGKRLHRESWRVHGHAPGPAARSPRRPAGIIGGDACSRSLLQESGVQPVAGDELPEGLLADPATTLVLADTSRGRSFRDWMALDAVEQWLRRGGRLIALPGAFAGDDTSPLAPLPQTADHAYVRAGGDGLLRDLADEHFREWGNDGVVARVVFRRPTTGPAIAPLDSGEPSEGLAYSPLTIVAHGQGHVILSGLELLERALDTPAAAVLLERLLHEPLGEAPAKRVCIVAGAEHGLHELLGEVGAIRAEGGETFACDGGSPNTLKDPRLSESALDTRLADGGTVLICGLTPETVEAWSQRLGVPMALQDDVRFNLARATDHHLLSGLNNYDLCWVSRGEKQPIVRHTLDVVPSAYRTLIQTVATGWEDYQATAEQHKVALMYRRLEAFAGPRAAVLEIPRGPGRIIVSQLLLTEARPPFRDRAHRILSRWLDVLGVARRDEVSPLTPRQRAIVDAAGFITEWLVLGPFHSEAGYALDVAFVDESALRPAEGSVQASQTWRRVGSAFPQVDLTERFEDCPEANRVAYAGIYVYSPQDRSVLLDAPNMVSLRAGADGGTKILLNGQTVGRFDFVRELVLDSDRVDPLPLRRGWNTLVIKLHNPAGRWRFAARLVTGTGEPVSGLQVQLRPPA
jgi:hypothetical protein